LAHRDNWGWRARIGMFIVGVECVPEAEWWAMCPPGVSVHSARVSAKTPWATWINGSGEVQLAEDLARGAKQFSGMRLSSIVVGHSSSSIAGGRGWDEATVQALQHVLPDDVAVTTNGLDCASALRAMNVRRPYLVFPPWFSEDTAAAGAQYVGDLGFEPAGYLRHDPGPKWRDLAPNELYAHGLGFEQDVERLYTEVRQSCPPNADGVLIAGTGFRCVGIIDALEADLGRPVVTANQASLWHALKLSSVRVPICGYGCLLQ
jgi:maleate isomerase